MNRRSGTIIAAGLVFALMAGTLSRAATITKAAGTNPVKIVVQTPAAAPSFAGYERE